jgi:hypothetical protein
MWTWSVDCLHKEGTRETQLTLPRRRSCSKICAARKHWIQAAMKALHPTTQSINSKFKQSKRLYLALVISVKDLQSAKDVTTKILKTGTIQSTSTMQVFPQKVPMRLCQFQTTHTRLYHQNVMARKRKLSL